MRFALLACAVPLLALGGCMESAEDRFPAPSTAPLVGKLSQARDCSDLVERLRSDALAKLEIDAYRLSSAYSSSPGYPSFDAGIGAPTTGAPGADSGGGVRYTETNTQIAGVDESDFVETDGARIFLLHDDQFMVFATTPPGTLVQKASIALGGVPAEMFVANGRAVVFSRYFKSYAPPALDIAPACGFPISTVDETKVTVLDVSGETPVIVSERFLNGDFLRARRHGDTVRVFLTATSRFRTAEAQPTTYDPTTYQPIARERYLDNLEAWRNRERARITTAELSDFVRPDVRLVGEERVDEAIQCDRFFLGESAETSNGLSRIVGFSMREPSLIETTAVSGYAGVVFASHDAVLLAEPDYRFDLLTGVATQQSALHAFTLDGIGLDFVGSGRIEGMIRDSYSIDESEGVFRIVSTELRRTASTPGVDADAGAPVTNIGNGNVSYVSTFEAKDGSIRRLGRSAPIGEGETVQSVRFLGDTAYVVTFLQVDPLFVVDVSNPAAPTLKGELTIPGFSSYIHPLGENHLLTVGTSADWGLAIQVFDVTDPMAPSQLYVHSLPSAYSSAQYDPHAFVFDDVTGLLAIPVTQYLPYDFESRLDLFHVSVGSGITPAGSVEHSSHYGDCSDGGGYYGCGYVGEVRRGLFIDDYVYAISTRAISASLSATPAVQTAALDLPAPTFWYTPYLR